MSKTNNLPYDAVYVFHDSENCYVPRFMEMRGADGRLLRLPDGGIQFGPPLKVQGVVIVKEVLRSALACAMGAESASRTDVLYAFNKVKYYFVRNNHNATAFTLPDQTAIDFSAVRGVEIVYGTGKPDGVDNKIKSLMSAALDEVRVLPHAERSRVLFVLVSGDRDFTPELTSAKTMGLGMVVIHSADCPIRESIEHVLDPGFTPCCWLNNVAAARNAAGNPYYHALAPGPHGVSVFSPPVFAQPLHHAAHFHGGGGAFAPPAPKAFRPAGAAPTAGVPKHAALEQGNQVLCRQLYVSNPKVVWFTKACHLPFLRDTVRAIHPAFLVREPPNGSQRAANGDYPCCDLVYAVAFDLVAPSPGQINQAVQVLHGELAKIVEDSPLTLQGVIPEQLKNSMDLKSFMQNDRIYVYLLNLKPSTTGTVPAANAGSGSGPAQTEEMQSAARDLHTYILSTAAVAGSPENKLAAVNLAGFYAQCSPARKALIQGMKIAAFCEANSNLLRYITEPLCLGKPVKGWILALPVGQKASKPSSTSTQDSPSTTRAVLVYSVSNLPGRDRVKQRLLSMCAAPSSPFSSHATAGGAAIFPGAGTGAGGIPFTAGPAGVPKAVAQVQDSEVRCHQLFVADHKVVWFTKIYHVSFLRDTVRAIHPAFLVREPPNGSQRAANGEYPCCDLVYAVAFDLAAPLPGQINQAVQVLHGELNKIVVDAPLTLQGLTSTQIKDNNNVKSFAQKERVYFYLPDLKLEVNPSSVAVVTSGTTASAVAGAGSAQEMLSAAYAMHTYILSTSAAAGSGEQRLAAVSLAGFYAQCSPARKAMIQGMKIAAFCEANSNLLRYSLEASGQGKPSAGWIHALPAPERGVRELFNFILERGVVHSNSGDPRQCITDIGVGEFYGPNGAHPELKAVITQNGQRKLFSFLRMYPTYFETKPAPAGEEAKHLIFAKYAATIPLPAAGTGKSGSASQSSAPATPLGSPTSSARVILVYSADNTPGRDRLTQMLLSLCPLVTDTLTVTKAASIGMCRAALPMLKSLAFQHGVTHTTTQSAPGALTIQLSGTQQHVAKAKGALQACLGTMQTTHIAVPEKWESKSGLLHGLRMAARELLSGDESSDSEDDNLSVVSGTSSAAPDASNRCMHAHMKMERIHDRCRIQAVLAFLPSIGTTSKEADQENYRSICAALQKVANEYTEFFCKDVKILSTANQSNLARRFSLYEARRSGPGILLCGSPEAVQEATDALCKIPERDRIEQRVYKAANRSVAFLLKNKLHFGVLQSMKQAVINAGAQVTPYMGPQSASNTALFTIQGRQTSVQDAFQRANAIEAKWVESLVEKPLCGGNVTPSQVKYLTEESRALLNSLSTQHGVYLQHTTDVSANAQVAAPAVRRLLKAHMGLVELQVVLGNILTVGCDAIVNPANEHLSHGAGLAAAIADAAGRADMDREGAQLKAKLPLGRVALGSSVCTGAYKLNQLNKHAKLVIHAVGPRCTTGSATERAQYRRCVMSALDLAVGTDRAHVEYLTFTLMGTGVYGWPVDLAASLLVESIAEWVHQATARGQVKLKRIVLADMIDASAKAMAQAVVSFNDRLPSLLADMRKPMGQTPVPPLPAPQRPQYKWYWECFSGDSTVFNSAEVKQGGRRWVPYDYDQVMQIEDAIAHNTMPVLLRGDINQVSNGAVYRIAKEAHTTFDRNETVQYTQTRTTPGVQLNFKRAVRREAFTDDMIIVGYNDPVVVLYTPDVQPASVPITQPSAPRGLQSVSRIVADVSDAIAASGGYSFLGEEAHMVTMEGALLDFLRQAKKISEQVYDLSFTEPENWEDVLTRLRGEFADAGVEAEVLPEDPPSTASVGAADARRFRVSAVGASNLMRGELAANTCVIKMMQRSVEESQVRWPATWTDGPFSVQDDKVQLVDVARDSMEWDEVELQWRCQSVAPGEVLTPLERTSLGNEFTLVSIKRVQNPLAWASYYSRVRLTAEKISTPDSTVSVFARANEWVMKHGTLRTDPVTVVSSAEGIDFRYCENGYFGRAAYTAEDAIYSDAYSYQVPNSGGDRQMLLVRVAAGKIHNVEIDGCREGPHRSLRMPPAGFHSVRGNVGNASIRRMALMVYQTDTAYPSYLLTYRKV